MDIVGIGTAIVECLRTEREIHRCQRRKHAVEHFAAHWAAKEAILKCLGIPWSHGLGWPDLEIRTGPAGQPCVHMCGGAKDRAQNLHVADILITTAHCRAYATAYALAVRLNPPAIVSTPPE
jgi:holo-[acyl-carrier protein] synthase